MPVCSALLIMPRILEILTRSDDALARSLIEEELALHDCRVEVVVLREAGQDYEQLLEKVFQADYARVW